MSDLSVLRAHLDGLGRVLLGYSGGVDSALLAAVAAEAMGPARVLAVIARSASYPLAALPAAVALAADRGIPLREVATEELADPRYAANPVNRCYYCKTELWSRLVAIAQAEGFDAVLDGTNADDLREHRPGLRAAREHGVRAPLAELGWSKADVRRAARAIGLPVWDAPASPCLSSRIRYGLTVTPARLRQVEAAEAFVRGLGVAGDLRVRHLGDRARVEVGPGEQALMRARWTEVEAVLLGLGFAAAELAPEGYRRGNLLVLGAAST